MLPFYHPTSIVALDDDPLFLESFAFHFGEEFICSTFTQPEQALKYFEDSSKFQMFSDGFFSPETGLLDSVGGRPGDHLLKMDGALLAKLMGESDRFRQISLLVVDYAMPGMNGIEVCRRLKAHPARKILLTGKAGKDTAVKAFNEGIIDCFLMKQMPDLPRVLDLEMQKLQRKYFKELTAPLQLAFATRPVNLTDHEGLNDYFLKLYDARGVVEYYHHTTPPGLMMISDDGEAMFLTVQDGDTLRAAFEIATDQNAPDELISLLANRSVVPLFPEEAHAYQPQFKETWRSHVWPAKEVTGDPLLYVSLITSDDIAPHISSEVFAFSDFRDARE
jgi:CheY-like chemotaxis protein